MVRCAVLDLDNHVVLNLIEYNSIPVGVPPGFSGNIIAVAATVHEPRMALDGSNNPIVPPSDEPSGPDFGTVPPFVVASALNVTVANGDIPSIDGVFNVIGAFYEDVGEYTFLFLVPQSDTNYFALASGVVLREVEKATDYITVEAVHANGSRFDPSCFGLNIYRFP